MKLHIPRDQFDNYHPPHLFLCHTNKEIIGELKAYDISGDFKWNTYSELNFTIDRHYNDAISGETLVDPLFDKLEGLRKVYVEGFGYFVVQDPDSKYSDNETKTVSAFSSEYETANKYLENFYVNTGEDDSVEVIYNASQYGEDYYLNDEKYKLATGFEAYTRYYYKEYTSTNNYVFTEIQILDASDYAAKQADPAYSPLYVTKYPSVQFYNPSNPQLSLLHLVFDKLPEWKIKYVDSSLCKKVRKFSEDRIAIYDFIMNDVCDTFECICEWDTINNEVSFYEEEEDGITDDNYVQTRYETDVFIDRENLANEINIKYSTDDIKTKLKVIGGDDLTIRDINIGQNYIMNLDYYHTVDWMGQDLYNKYSSYKALLEEKQTDYSNAMKQYVAAYNVWNDLMNAVPADNSVLMIGDEFTKLYCVYTPVTTDISTALNALTKKLDLYRVSKDEHNTSADNVLLTLKKENGDSATIRVANIDNTYKVRVSVTNASTGEISTNAYTLTQWIEGALTASYIGVSNFTVKSIGTIGAYLCLVKDETKAELNNNGEANKSVLRTYGVNLLKERYDTYQKIFITQTEGYMSKDGAKCIASDTEPAATVAGTRWLDTSQTPLVLKEYTGSGWSTLSDATNIADAADYTRYKENYTKMKATQEVLVEKEREANYYLNGDAIKNRTISSSTSWTETIFHNIAVLYFDGLYGNGNYTIAKVSWDVNLPMYKFNITYNSSTKEYIVYLQDKTPYIAYSSSRAACQVVMDNIKKVTDMESYFSLSEWERLSPFIREDEFSDSNFALTGYESEEERTYILEELKKAAEKELKSISQPSLEFSMTMANILALPEFDSIKNQFALGNFIRVGIRPDYVKRSRLLEVHINFSDISDFSADFGNLITTRSEIDKHAELLKQAVSAGKSVASSASNWQKAVEKSNRIDEAIKDGLKDAALQVGASSGQDISWDDRGILCRKKLADDDTNFEDEQIMITNNRIVMTSDDWKTSKGVFGKFSYDSNHDGTLEEHFGVLADAIVGGYIEGSEIHGGSLEISGNGGTFKVNEDGTVKILVGGVSPYASKEDVEKIPNDLKGIRDDFASQNATNKDEFDNIWSKVNVAMTKEAVTLSISEAMKKGVSEVQTTTGFTFDDSGLNISKTDAKTNTQITENGMTVKTTSTGQEVLTANDTGVNALNLTSRQYLIVGKNSRFEDYNGNRTACFFIG